MIELDFGLAHPRPYQAVRIALQLNIQFKCDILYSWRDKEAKIYSIDLSDMEWEPRKLNIT